jgi:hypothetical protein
MCGCGEPNCGAVSSQLLSVSLHNKNPKMSARRLNYKAKSHFLTYPKAHESLEKPDVFTLLQDCAQRANFEITDAYIARESHEDGTPHFHCYVKTNKRVNVYSDTWDLKFPDPDCEQPTVLTQHGNYQAVRDVKKVCEYIAKEDSEVFCFGPFTIADVIRARKSKTSQACAMVLRQGTITIDMLNEYPEMLLTLDKLKRNLEIVNDIKKRRVEVPEPSSWYPWQEYLNQLLSSDPHPRQINWFVDHIGNSGKSFMASFLISNDLENTFMVDGGAKRDILYGYRGQRVVIFDFAREKEQSMDGCYSTIETLKNGLYFSTKYESEQRLYKVPHVIVFSNWNPDQSKLSADRWNIQEIQADKTCKQFTGEQDVYFGAQVN